MERQLRAPYVPPKDKLISEQEIKKQESLGKLIMDEIKVLYFLKNAPLFIDYVCFKSMKTQLSTEKKTQKIQIGIKISDLDQQKHNITIPSS